MKKLDGKVALVTGAGGYIGRGICMELAAEGAVIAVTDINAETAAETVKAVKAAGAKAEKFCVDLCDREQIGKLVDDVAASLGSIDILINIAGGSARQNCSEFHLATDEVIDRIIDINLKAPLFLTRAVLQGMVERKQGKIVNIGSITGVQGCEHVVDYSSAKGGIISFTKALCKEVGKYGINVNCVSPGLVPRPEENPAHALRGNFFGGERACKPADIAKLAVFLCTDSADFITGQNYIVDGGRSLGMQGNC